MSVGTARKNENSVAALRDRPNSMPPMMVAPEREVPGISAKHCAMPTLNASSHVIACVLSTRDGGSALDHQDDHAADDEGERHRHAWKRWALMYFENASPSTAAGMNATIRLR